MVLCVLVSFIQLARGVFFSHTGYLPRSATRERSGSGEGTSVALFSTLLRMHEPRIVTETRLDMLFALPAFTCSLLTQHTLGA